MVCSMVFDMELDFGMESLQSKNHVNHYRGHHPMIIQSISNKQLTRVFFRFVNQPLENSLMVVLSHLVV